MLFIYEITASTLLRTLRKLANDPGTLSSTNYSILTLLEKSRSVFVKKPVTLLFLHHKSANICQIDTSKVSNQFEA